MRSGDGLVPVMTILVTILRGRGRSRSGLESVLAQGALLRLLLAPVLALGGQVRAETIRADVCIYDGTAAGLAAAVQTARLGKTAVIAEPGRHLGGMTSGGLGATDIGNKRAIGGIAREFCHRVAQHYFRDSAISPHPSPAGTQCCCRSS